MGCCTSPIPPPHMKQSIMGQLTRRSLVATSCIRGGVLIVTSEALWESTENFIVWKQALCLRSRHQWVFCYNKVVCFWRWSKPAFPTQKRDIVILSIKIIYVKDIHAGSMLLHIGRNSAWSVAIRFNASTHFPRHFWISLQMSSLFSERMPRFHYCYATLMASGGPHLCWTGEASLGSPRRAQEPTIMLVYPFEHERWKYNHFRRSSS